MKEEKPMVRTRVTSFRLELVKEDSGIYELRGKKVTSDNEAAKLFREFFNTESLTEEVVMLMTMNTKNNVTGVFEVARGTLNGAMIHPREIFKRAILNNASSIMIAHNHPSGDCTPSGEDKNMTYRLIDCGKLLGIELMDHIILGENHQFFSLKNNNLM